MVENRQYTRNFDSALPGKIVGKSGGILIWNIKNQGLNNRETDLIEADADEYQEMNNMAEDVFRPSVYVTNKIHDDSYPATLRLRNGSTSKFAVTGYTSTAASITVSFKINYTPPSKPTATSVTYVVPEPPDNATMAPEPPEPYMLVKWNANPEGNLSTYLVYRRVNSDGVDGWQYHGGTGAGVTEFHDASINSSTKYYYKITAENTNGYESGFSNTVSGLSGILPKQSILDTQDETMPVTLALLPNYPNPFNPDTKISYQLPEARHIKLVIYNVLGEQVRVLVNSEKPAGRYTTIWNGRNEAGLKVAAGTYLCRLEVGHEILTRKMALLQ